MFKVEVSTVLITWYLFLRQINTVKLFTRYRLNVNEMTNCGITFSVINFLIACIQFFFLPQAIFQSDSQFKKSDSSSLSIVYSNGVSKATCDTRLGIHQYYNCSNNFKPYTKSEWPTDHKFFWYRHLLDLAKGHKLLLLLIDIHMG